MKDGSPNRAALPWRAIVSCLLVLLPAGCTGPLEYIRNGFKVGPNYKRSPAPVARDWIDADDVRIRRESPDLSHWWTVFNDPALNGLVVEAYRQNLTLREAGFRVLEARATLGIAIGSFFPQTQNMNGDYTRRGVSEAVANRVATPERWFSQWDYGFNLAWEIDFWGRFRRAIEAADASLDASVENYDDVLVTLLGDLGRSYVRLRTLEQQIAYLRTNVELQRIALGIAQARFKGGQATELDPDQAESILAQTEAMIPQLQAEHRIENDRTCTLLGIPPEELLKRIGEGAIPTAPVEVAVGIPAELLSRRPDVRRAERQAAAQCAEIGVAESALYPTISLVGTFGWSAQYLRDLFNDQAFRGAIAPSFTWNILNYGRLLNNVRFQDATFLQLVTAYQNTVIKAGAEVENGLARFLYGQLRARYQAQSVQAALKAVQVAIAQYKGGLTDFNRVALLEQDLVTQQITLAAARGEIARGLVDTYEALGGGWQIRCAPGPPPDPAAPPAPAGTAPAPAPLEQLPLPKPLPAADDKVAK
jgi:NodT family efflux transporter outer membrane factor (OMF) lipoprotein